MTYLKSKRKPKSERQKLIKANDDLLRQIVRLRDKVCQKTGKTDNLQVAHFWRRNLLRTRWDLDNVCLLQGGIHFYWAHSRFQDFTEFWLKRLGKDKFEALEIRARYVSPVKEYDLIMIKEQLNRLLQSLTNGGHNG